MNDETEHRIAALRKEIEILWHHLDAKDNAASHERKASELTRKAAEIRQSVELMRKELESQYDRLTSANERYTNTIVLVGFASYFATWTFTKDLLTKSEMALVGALGLISVGAFIIAELIGMLLRAYSARQLQQLIGREYLPDEFNAKVELLKSDERRIMSSFYMVWLLLFTVSVSAAFVGGFRLVWALGRIYYPLLPTWF